MATLLDQIRVDEIQTLMNVSNMNQKQEWDMISQFKSECTNSSNKNKRRSWLLIKTYVVAMLYLFIDNLLKNYLTVGTDYSFVFVFVVIF